MADPRKTKPKPLSVDTTGRRPSSSGSSRPSTSSLRPPSSVGFSRPPSSLASPRPPSSASLRPSSSASTNRPSSAASFRPISQASHRPASRFSYRPARQASRLYSLTEQLVSQVTGMTNETADEDDLIATVDHVAKNLDQGGGPSIGMDKLNARIRGLAQKAQIRSQDTWAEALEESYSSLKSHMQRTKDLDQEITPNRLPEHMQLLIMLSTPSPDPSIAQEYLRKLRNPEKPATTLTWRDILSEEPYEGQHWQGVYGLPPGSTVEGWETMSIESTPPLSPLSYIDDRSMSPPELDLELDTTSDAEHAELLVRPDTAYPSRLLFDHRQDVEVLQAKQYWRKDWRNDAPIPKSFDLGVPSSLGPSMVYALREQPSSETTYIHEHDAIRELLMGLQGHQNMLIQWSHTSDLVFSFQPILDFPRVLHLTVQSQKSLLSRFCELATTLEHLRKFVAKVYASVNKVSAPSSGFRFGLNQRVTRVVEAFAEAIAAELQTFDQWCAAREQDLIQSAAGIDNTDIVVTFLSTEKAIRDKFSQSFSVLLDCLRQVMRAASRAQDREAEVWVLIELPGIIPASHVSSRLLNALLDSTQRSLTMGDPVTHDVLMKVFVTSARPIWSMTDRWIRDGMPLEDGAEKRAASLDPEFFIEDHELPLYDPDFWTESFALRGFDEEDARQALPSFLRLIAPHVLAAGKAVGLTRALGIASDCVGGYTSWPDISAVIETAAATRYHSAEDLARLVYDWALPVCIGRENHLATVITQECELEYHLSAIQDIYLMRRGDVASTFTEILFAKMDNGQSWTDYHFLNSSLRQIIEAGAPGHIPASALRLTYRGRRDTSAQFSDALGGLRLEYTAPFPLSYVFTPEAMGMYGSVFVLLLQIRRSKRALEKVLVRASNSNVVQSVRDMKVFYALRSRLSWFIGGLLDHITTYVLQTEVKHLEKKYRAAQSLDDIIAVHHEHLDRLLSRCFLQSQNSSLKAMIIAILDMCLHFGDCFVAFAGDTTYDAGRRLSTHKHRSRRAAHLRQNVIGFELPPAESSDGSSDEDAETKEPEMSFAHSVSFADLDFFGQVDRMSRELDSLVRSLRKGVEALASDTTEAASAFGIFAFTLEDWDR